MILEFYGPFHFMDIDPKTGKIITGKNFQDDPNPDQAGIYIWGFMYNYENKKVSGQPINFKDVKKEYKKETMQFVPYYVGKSKGNLFKDRIFHHQNVRNDSANVHGNKYIRFNFDTFIDKFYKEDEGLPIHKHTPTYKAKIENFVSDDSKITYFNSEFVLKKIYGNRIVLDSDTSGSNKNQNYPINIQKIDIGNLIDDSLFKIVNCMENFWFCYAIVKPEDLQNLRKLEVSTYYSLNGITISHTDNCPLNSIAKICSKADIRIFNNDKPKNDFPGY